MPAPVCTHSGVLLTVLNILQECPRFKEEHGGFHLHGALRDIFREIRRNVSKAMTFLCSV
jgi:metal-dependent hydrolase (beta-lactamase superfamily II)